MGPIEFGEEPVVRNLYAIDRARISLELVGVGPEPIEEETVFRFVHVVVNPEMPLIGIVGEAQRESACPVGRQIGIVLKCSRHRVRTGLVCDDISHGNEISGRVAARRCLLEER